MTRAGARCLAAFSLSILSVIPAAHAQPASSTAIADRTATVNGVRMHYLMAGKGDPIILLHGYAQTSHMWRPLMTELAKTNLVIAPDLRWIGPATETRSGLRQEDDGAGRSRAGAVARPFAGAHRRARHRADGRVRLRGAVSEGGRPHRPARRVPPGVGDWETVWLLRDLWHFHFYGVTPLKLVAGRERIYFEHFWNDFAADPKHSIPEADRQFYAAAYAAPDGMRASFEVFHTFPQDAKDFAEFAKTKLTMPMLVLTGEKASGQTLIKQAQLVADHVDGVVIDGSGHWLMEEATGQVVPKLVAFLKK